MREAEALTYQTLRGQKRASLFKNCGQREILDVRCLATNDEAEADANYLSKTDHPAAAFAAYDT